VVESEQRAMLTWPRSPLPALRALPPQPTTDPHSVHCRHTRLSDLGVPTMTDDQPEPQGHQGVQQPPQHDQQPSQGGTLTSAATDDGIPDWAMPSEQVREARPGTPPTRDISPAQTDPRLNSTE